MRSPDLLGPDEEESHLSTRWSTFAAAAFLSAGVLAALLGVFGVGLEVIEFSLLLAVLAYVAVGALLVARRPNQPIGWLFAGSGLLLLVGALAGSFVNATYVAGKDLTPLIAAAVWLGAWYWTPALVGMTVFAFLLFPTGHPISRRWSLVGWLGAMGAAGSAFGLAFAEKVCSGSDIACNSGVAVTVANPLGWISQETAGLLQGIFAPALGLALLGSLISLVVRFRRSTGVERAQLKWFTFAASALVFLFAAGSVLDQLDPSLEQKGLAILALGVALIPLSVGIALFRYRLYEIDRIINRTLVYGLVVAVLVAVYAGAVVLLQLVLPERGDLAVAASTLAVAALFNPLRRRIQRLVDRRFYRSRYDAEQVVEEFAARLRDEVDLEELTSDWVGVVQETVQPTSVSVWVRERP